MNRWNAGALSGAVAWMAALLVAAAIAWPATTQAQAGMTPQDLQYARLRVLQSPEILLDEQPARLSPGARIRHTSNLIALPASLTGQDLPVLFRREPGGLVHEAWVLREDEAAALQQAATPAARNETLARLLASRR